MFCKNCGHELQPGTEFCTNCGAPLNGQYAAPPPPPPQQPFAPAGGAPKSKMTAGLLGIFLGAWGVHNFYLGYTNKAILQIVLTIVTCGAAGLWGLIEGIMILTGSINTDANGQPLAD